MLDIVCFFWMGERGEKENLEGRIRKVIGFEGGIKKREIKIWTSLDGVMDSWNFGNRRFFREETCLLFGYL